MSDRIYLCRHGEATARGSQEPDEHRPLTERGRRRFYRLARRFARRLAKSRGAVDVIVTSPAPRAVMTAELLGRALSHRGPIEVWAELAPELPPGPVLTRLSSRGERLVLVGHEPQLGRLLGLLCGGDSAVPAALKKGAIATLRRRPSEPHHRLRRLLEP